MASGSIRSNIGPDQNMTQGEDRPLRYRVVDEDGEPVLSFAGWTFSWYLMATQATDHADALVTKTSGLGEITSSAPNVIVSIEPEDTEDLRANAYVYELWRTDTGNVVRLAFGTLQIVD